jgi:hypothetical protein
MFHPGKATPGLVMLNTLKQNSWWLAVTLAGFYQQGAVAPGAAAMVIAALVKAITRAVWLSLPQPWRHRLCNQLTSSQTKITLLIRKRPSSNQEHHHAYQ